MADVFKTLNLLSKKHEISAELGGPTYTVRLARLCNDEDVACMHELVSRPPKPYRIGDVWVIHVMWDPDMDCNLVYVMTLEEYQRELASLTAGVEQTLFDIL